MSKPFWIRTTGRMISISKVPSDSIFPSPVLCCWLVLFLEKILNVKRKDIDEDYFEQLMFIMIKKRLKKEKEQKQPPKPPVVPLLMIREETTPKEMQSVDHNPPKPSLTHETSNKFNSGSLTERKATNKKNLWNAATENLQQNIVNPMLKIKDLAAKKNFQLTNLRFKPEGNIELPPSISQATSPRGFTHQKTQGTKMGQAAGNESDLQIDDATISKPFFVTSRSSLNQEYEKPRYTFNFRDKFVPKKLDNQLDFVFPKRNESNDIVKRHAGGFENMNNVDLAKHIKRFTNEKPTTTHEFLPPPESIRPSPRELKINQQPQRKSSNLLEFYPIDIKEFELYDNIKELKTVENIIEYYQNYFPKIAKSFQQNGNTKSRPTLPTLSDSQASRDNTKPLLPAEELAGFTDALFDKLPKIDSGGPLPPSQLWKGPSIVTLAPKIPAPIQYIISTGGATAREGRNEEGNEFIQKLLNEINEKGLEKMNPNDMEGLRVLVKAQLDKLVKQSRNLRDQRKKQNKDQFIVNSNPPPPLDDLSKQKVSVREIHTARSNNTQKPPPNLSTDPNESGIGIWNPMKQFPYYFQSTRKLLTSHGQSFSSKLAKTSAGFNPSSLKNTVDVGSFENQTGETQVIETLMTNGDKDNKLQGNETKPATFRKTIQKEIKDFRQIVEKVYKMNLPAIPVTPTLDLPEHISRNSSSGFRGASFAVRNKNSKQFGYSTTTRKNKNTSESPKPSVENSIGETPARWDSPKRGSHNQSEWRALPSVLLDPEQNGVTLARTNNNNSPILEGKRKSPAMLPETQVHHSVPVTSLNLPNSSFSLPSLKPHAESQSPSLFLMTKKKVVGRNPNLAGRVSQIVNFIGPSKQFTYVDDKISELGQEIGRSGINSRVKNIHLSPAEVPSRDSMNSQEGMRRLDIRRSGASTTRHQGGGIPIWLEDMAVSTGQKKSTPIDRSPMNRGSSLRASVFPDNNNIQMEEIMEKVKAEERKNAASVMVSPQEKTTVERLLMQEGIRGLIYSKCDADPELIAPQKAKLDQELNHEVRDLLRKLGPLDIAENKKMVRGTLVDRLVRIQNECEDEPIAKQLYDEFVKAKHEGIDLIEKNRYAPVARLTKAQAIAKLLKSPNINTMIQSLESSLPSPTAPAVSAFPQDDDLQEIIESYKTTGEVDKMKMKALMEKRNDIFDVVLTSAQKHDANLNIKKSAIAEFQHDETEFSDSSGPDLPTGRIMKASNFAHAGSGVNGEGKESRKSNIRKKVKDEMIQSLKFSRKMINGKMKARDNEKRKLGGAGSLDPDEDGKGYTGEGQDGKGAEGKKKPLMKRLKTRRNLDQNSSSEENIVEQKGIGYVFDKIQGGLPKQSSIKFILEQLEKEDLGEDAKIFLQKYQEQLQVAKEHVQRLENDLEERILNDRNPEEELRRVFDHNLTLHLEIDAIYMKISTQIANPETFLEKTDTDTKISRRKKNTFLRPEDAPEGVLTYFDLKNNPGILQNLIAEGLEAKQEMFRTEQKPTEVIMNNRNISQWEIHPFEFSGQYPIYKTVKPDDEEEDGPDPDVVPNPNKALTFQKIMERLRVRNPKKYEEIMGKLNEIVDWEPDISI